MGGASRSKNRAARKVITTLLSFLLVMTLIPVGAAAFVEIYADDADITDIVDADGVSADDVDVAGTVDAVDNAGVTDEASALTDETGVADEAAPLILTDDQNQPLPDELVDNELLDETADSPEPEAEESADTPFTTLAAGDWDAVTNDPIWGNAFVYNKGTGGGNAIASGAELATALDSVNTANGHDAAIPYIIYIDRDITMTTSYPLSGMNVVLRKWDATDTGNESKPWDFSKPWVNTNAATPDLYDGVADYKIYQSATVRHFTIGGTVKLTLENITLDGQQSTWTVPTTLGANPAPQVQGGIIVNTTDSNFTFAGNISNCSAGGGYGGGIQINSGLATATLDVFGGVFDHNSGVTSASISPWTGSLSAATRYVTIRNYTILQNGYTTNEGGAICFYGTNGTLTIQDNVKIRDNTADGGGGGVWFGQNPLTSNASYYNTASLLIKDDVEISGNITRARPNRPAGSGFYSSMGGGIYSNGINNTITISGNAQIKGNFAGRGGGGIALGSQAADTPTLHLNGGSISGNTALGTSRFVDTAFALDKYTIGGGGGIYAYNPSKIIIPDVGTVFSGNVAPFVALVDVSNPPTSYTPWVTGEAYYDHISSSYNDSVNSAGFPTPYDNLYNNYDIGTPNNNPNGLYAEIELKTVPNAGGNITQSSDQLAGYIDVFGDGRFWKELNQAGKLSFTAVAADGYIFNNWTYSSTPALLDTEWSTAFGGTLPSGATISGFTMPDVKTTLTANFGTVANITKLEDHMFEKVWSSGYTAPDAWAVPLINTGQTAASDIKITLSDFKKDDQTFATNPFDYTTGTVASVAANSTDATSLTIQPKTGLTMGAYTASVTLEYTDGAGNTVAKTSEVGFALYGDEPMILTILSDFDFGTLGAGYAPPAEPVRIYNYGNGQATITNVAITGTDAASFQLLPAGKITGTVAAHGSDTTTWTVSPKADLPGGEYHAKLVVTYGSGKTASKDISVKTIGAGNITADNLVWTPVKEGYSVSPYQSIALSNSGDMAGLIIDIASQVSPSAYNVQASTSVGVPAKAGVVSGTNTSWMIAPKKGLTSGNHLETFTITYNDGTGATKTSTFTAQFVVQVAGAPTGTITLNGNTWASFLNAITFGLFFEKEANTQTVTITAVDDTGNPPSISYYISSLELTSAQALAVSSGGTDGTDGWTAYPSGTGFDIEDSAGKKIIYALLEGDGTGKFSIINSAGIVVYENSTATADVIDHTKKTTNPKTATVNLNGNTIDTITNGASTLVYGTDYTFAGNTITVTAAYLDTITTTPSYLTVHYKPQGETYVPAVAGTPSADNEEPATTNITVNILEGYNHWIDKGTEYVYTTNATVPVGADNRVPTAVTTWNTSPDTGLYQALELVNGESTDGYSLDKPYVIEIGSNITMSAVYPITDKNIVLKSSDATKYALYTTLQTTSSTPHNARHFSVSGTESKLVLDNIVIDGQRTSFTTSNNRGGIDNTAAHFIFSGEITGCANQYGAITETAVRGHLEVIGGNIHDNYGYYGAGISSDWFGTGTGPNAVITVSGNTIVTRNYGSRYGAGVTLGYGSAGVLTIKDNVEISYNQGRMAGGIMAQTGTVNLEGNVLITHNTSVGGSRDGSAVFPGTGGGVMLSGANGKSVLNVSDNVEISYNEAVRGGGGIALGYDVPTNTVTANLMGGTIKNNTALGSLRELSGSYTNTDVWAIGGGGGIYSYQPQNINIPANSTVEFSGNSAPYVALTDVSNYTPWISGENYANHIQKDFGQNTSTGLIAPLDNLYNNYDIGVPNNRPHDSYSELSLKVNPALGGTISQAPEQLAGYTDVFGDGRFWKELNQGGGLKFIAEPADGYVFDRWSNTSIPALTPDEWTTALGGAPATILANATINSFAMPDVKTELVANFKTAANLNRPLDYVFEAEYDSLNNTYTQPAPWAVPLTNSGETGATNVQISITDTKKDGLAFGSAPTDLFTWSSSSLSLAAGATDDTSLTIQPVTGLDQGAYTATLTLTYDDGSGKTIIKKSEIGFALYGNEPMILTISSDFEFGTLAEGYVSPTEDVRIYNYGTSDADITNIEISGAEASAFEIVSGPGNSGVTTGTVLGRNNNAGIPGDSIGYWKVSPNAGLLSGDYTARLTVSYGAGKTAYKDIHLTVTGPAHLSATNLSFEPKNQGYSTPPNYKPIDIINSGDLHGQIQSITSNKGAASVYTLQGNSADVPAKVSGVDGVNHSYLIAPKAGVAPGNNLETFTITYLDGSGGAAQTTTFTVQFTVIEAGAPTGKITVGTNEWNSFWNSVTFGLFAKNTQTVEIANTTLPADIDPANIKVSYHLSNTELTETAALALTDTGDATTGWQGYTAALSINPNDKKIVYAKIETTFASNNKSVILNTAGIVAYTDSTQTGQNKSITRPSIVSGTVIGDIAVTLNGNTVAHIVNTTKGNEALTPGTHYTVNEGTGQITLTNAYLLTLTGSASPGTSYTFEVGYNPLGETYPTPPLAGSVAPAVTNFTVTVSKENQAALVINSSATHTYGSSYTITTPAAGTANGGTGTGAATYEIVTGGTGGGTISGSTLTITKAGTIFLRATRAGDENYNPQSSANFTLTVGKAASTPNEPTGLTAIYGDMLSSVSLTPYNTGAGKTSGTWTWNGTPNTTSVGTVAGSPVAHGATFTPDDTDNYNNFTGSYGVTVAQKELTVQISGIANKHYDGTAAATANYGTPNLSGIVAGDSNDAAGVELVTSGVVFTFNNADVGTGKTVTNTGALFSLSGTKNVNYSLKQPSGLTASITNGFTPVRGTHYTITPLSAGSGGAAGWTNAAFEITATDGYAVSLSNTVSGWTDYPTPLTISSAETVAGTVTFYVKRIGLDTGGIVQGEISVSKTESYKVDMTAPNGAQIDYKNTGLKALLNSLTFGLFFKATASDPVTAVIVGSDAAGSAPSGVAKVEYYATTIAYNAAAAAAVANGSTPVTWIDQSTTPLSILYGDKGKYHIFARITDNAGNVAVFYDSAVVFTDSIQSGVSADYTKLTSDITVDVNLNGNTVSGIVNTTHGGDVLSVATPTQYSVNPTGGTGGRGAITINSAYLDTLNAGTTYTFTVSYLPQGVDNSSAGAGSDAPTTTTFSIRVLKNSQAALSVTGISSPYTYGDAPVTVGTSGGSGTGGVSYEIVDPSVAGVASLAGAAANTATLNFAKPGTFKIKATKAGDGDYAPTDSTTAVITINKALPTLTLSATGTGIYGDDVNLAASVVKVGLGAVPTGSVGFYVDGTLKNTVALDANGKATYVVPLLSASTHNFEVRYLGNTYYKGYGASSTADTDSTIKATASFTVGLAGQTIVLVSPGDKIWGDADFALSLSALGTGTGAVTYSASPAGILDITGTNAEIVGVGTVTITADKAADGNHNSATDSVTIKIDKATPVWSVNAAGAPLTYGKTLADSTLSGHVVNGVGVYATTPLTGTVTWDLPSSVPDVSAIGGTPADYAVTFTPTGTDADHYNLLIGMANITVDKATPILKTALNATPILLSDPLSASTITGGTMNYGHGTQYLDVPGTWSWDDPTALGSSFNSGASGTYAKMASFAPTDTAHFNAASEAINVTAFSPKTVINPPPSADPLTYGDKISWSALDVASAKAFADTGGSSTEIPGTWAWTNGEDRATSVGTYRAEVTFTPDFVQADPQNPVVGGGYLPATADVDITVAPADPKLALVLPGTAIYGKPLSSVDLSNYTVEGVFGETLGGTLVWTDATLVPSDFLGTDGVGTYSAEATFTPTGTFAPLYKVKHFYIDVQVLADTSALDELAEDIVVPLLPALSEENYKADDLAALKAYLQAAEVVHGTPGVTQTAVNAAYDDLFAALEALKQDHPVLEHSANFQPITDTSAGFSVCFKGYFGSVLPTLGVLLDGEELVQSVTADLDTRSLSKGGSFVGTLVQGSARVSLTPEFLDTLPDGIHTITVNFDDGFRTGSGITVFEIHRPAVVEDDDDADGTEGTDDTDGADGADGAEAPKTEAPATGFPKTGDDPLPWLLVVLLVTAGVTTLTGRYAIKIRREGTRHRR